MSVPRMNVNSERYDELLRTEKHHAALAARLAEVEAENARLRELALVEAEGQHDEMLGATGLAAERDRLAQELKVANQNIAHKQSKNDRLRNELRNLNRALAKARESHD